MGVHCLAGLRVKCACGDCARIYVISAMKRPAAATSSVMEVPEQKKQVNGAAISVVIPEAAQHFKQTILNHFAEGADTLRVLSYEFWPKAVPIKAGSKNYNVRAACGSCFTVRLETQTATMVASCCRPIKDVEQPRSFSFRKRECELNEFIYQNLQRLCPCGRQTWNPLFRPDSAH